MDVESICKRILFQILGVSLATMLGAATCHAEAEWTILVYMNGKNNLEPHALTNFHDMATVGSSHGVNIVAQLGRPEKKNYSPIDGNWGGVKRFFVKKGSRPIPAEALEDLKTNGESTDMGSGATFQRFLVWGKQKYPAKRYMVVIWNHGQGWRFQLAPKMEARIFASQGKLAEARAITPAPPPIAGGFRAVSSDEDTGSILFNRDVQDALVEQFPSSRPLDLLGYDACLMGMLETAYGVSPYVRVMVASEELEPGTGWHYAPWLSRLTAAPKSTPEQLAAMVIDSYRGRYGDAEITTLSAVRLADVRKAAAKLSTWSKGVAADAAERQALLKARGELTPYGIWYDPSLNTSVDLIKLLELYEKQTANAQLRNLSTDARKDLEALVVANYASKRSADPATQLPFGSRGIAIYFPKDAADFKADYYHTGYLKTNKFKPVDFVREQQWADLLYATLGIKP